MTVGADISCRDHDMRVAGTARGGRSGDVGSSGGGAAAQTTGPENADSNNNTARRLFSAVVAGGGGRGGGGGVGTTSLSQRANDVWPATSRIDQQQQQQRRRPSSRAPAAAAAAAAGPKQRSWSFGCAADVNGRARMEDRHVAADVTGDAASPVLARYARAGLFAVMDGHSGPEAAELLEESLLGHVRAALAAQEAQVAACAGGTSSSSRSIDPSEALRAAVEAAEAELLARLSAAGCGAGSTLLAALLLDGHLYVANVGDCRAVLARAPACGDGDNIGGGRDGGGRDGGGRDGSAARQITLDHKPTHAREAARIAAAHSQAGGGGADSGGGDRATGGDGGAGPHTGRRFATYAAAAAEGAAAAPTAPAAAPHDVISPDGYLYGELAVARALGSAHLKFDPAKRALIPAPDMFSVPLSARDDLLLLASDGLWDVVGSAEAAALARRAAAEAQAGGRRGARAASAAARALVERAVRRGSADNVTVVAVLLHGRDLALPPTNSRLFRRSPVAAAAAAPALASSPARGGGAGGGGGGALYAHASAPTTPVCRGRRFQAGGSGDGGGEDFAAFTL